MHLIYQLEEGLWIKGIIFIPSTENVCLIDYIKQCSFDVSTVGRTFISE